MKEYRILISHVAKDKEIALKCVKALTENGVVGEGENRFEIVPVYMESETDGCIGDFIEWSENAVLNSHGVLAIITENTTETSTSADGIKANVKVVYNEISLARNEKKDILILRENGAALQPGYNLLLQNMKCAFFDEGDLKEKIEEVYIDIITHAKHRFCGKPLLEYAGKVGVRLIPSNIADTSNYLGRVAEIAKIDKCFEEGKRVVCITGFGGIGKTTLAKMYAKAHPDEPVSIVYCPSEEANLRDAVIRLGVEFDDPNFDKMTVEEKYAARIRQLRNLDRRTLVIIDNFNADFELRDNRMALDDFSEIEKCKFIISSRCTLNRKQVGLVEVGKLCDEEIAELFYRDAHCEKTAENDVLLQKLIIETNGHTMTIELAAKAIGIDENGVTLQEIVEGILSADAVTRLDDRYDGFDEYDTIYAHLRMLFNLSQVDEAQKLLLGSLSFVARYGLTVQELKVCVACDKKDLIRLVGLGYIQKSENTPARYSLHPLMSELAFLDFAQSVGPFVKFIGYLLTEKTKLSNDDTLEDLGMRLEFAEHLYERLLCLAENDPKVRNGLVICGENLGRIYQKKGDFAKTQGDLQRAEQNYSQEYEWKKRVFTETGSISARRKLSIACSNLANIAKAKGDMAGAEEYYKKEYELVKGVVEETGTAISCARLSLTCRALANIAKEKGDRELAKNYYMQSYELGRKIVSETDAKDLFPGFYLSCLYLGDFFKEEGNLEGARQFYEQGYNILKQITEETGTIESRERFSWCCKHLADLLKETGNLEGARQYYEQGYNIVKQITEETGTIELREHFGWCCEDLADLLKETGDLEGARQYYEQGYNIVKQIAEETGTIELREHLDWCCEQLAVLLKETGNLEGARQYYEQGYNIVRQIAEETDTINAFENVLVYCEYLAELAKERGDLESVWQYYQECYRLVKRISKAAGTIEARKDVLTYCDVLVDLALKRGDLVSEEKYAKQSYELAKAIAEEINTIESRRDLSVSCDELGNIAQVKGELEIAKQYYQQGYELAKAIAEETNTLEALDDLIVSNVKMSLTTDSDETKIDYLCAAFEIAENLFKRNADYNGRYKLVAQELSIAYKENGDNEGYQKMQNILKQLS